MLKKYCAIIPIIFTFIIPNILLGRIPTTSVRVSNFVQQLVQQDADFLIAQNDIPKTISTPGVYKLIEPITIGTGLTGFTISTDDVTLDLNGKKISGGATGVSIGLNRNNVTVQNGLISGCTITGVVAASGGTNITLQDLQIRSIGTGLSGIGISLVGVSNSTVRRCLVTSTAGTGLNATFSCQRLSIENSSFNNNTLNGAVINACSKSIMSGCTFSANTQEGLLITNGSQNIVVDSCNALDNTNNGFSLVSSNTILLTQCQSINNARSTNVAGFSAQNGYGNIFEECVANGMVTTSTNADEFAAGFLFAGTEQCSKIVNSEVGNITTPVGGNSIPYGISLQATLDTIATATSGGGQIIDASHWSPDGLYIATAERIALPAPNPKIYEYNKTTNTLILRFTGTANELMSTVKWAPNGNYVATGESGSTGNIRIFAFNKTTKTLGQITNPNIGEIINSVAWSFDSKFLAVGTDGGATRVYEFNTNPTLVQGVTPQTILTLVSNAAHGANVESVAWSPDGQFVAIGGAAGSGGAQIRVYEFDTSNKTLTQRDTKTPGDMTSIAWSFDGNFLAAGGASSSLFIYQFNKTTKVLTLVSSEAVNTNEVDWSPDGKFVVIASGNFFRIYPFNRNTKTLGTVTSVNHGPATDTVSWSPDGGRIVGGGTTSSGISIRLLTALKFPTKNNIIGNKTCCITGNQYSTGIGIAGSTIDNLIAQNISYRNDFNYQFATSAFTGGLNSSPKLLQNIAIPPV